MATAQLSQGFDVSLFQARRSELGLTLGGPFDYLAVTDSTNDDVLRLAKAGAPHGLVILAERQRQGRGRRGRVWLAEPGAGLTFSVLLRAPWTITELSVLPLVVGLAVREAVVRRVQRSVAVKWPNDVLVDDRKVSGVLCESYSHAGQVLAVVAGVGLNVRAQSFPSELATLVTTLEQAGASELERELLLVDLLAALERRLQELLAVGFARQRQELNGCDALVERRIQVGERVGIARGIAASGALIFEHDGRTEEVVSGTVSLLA